ncbi:hypothetical protein NL108_001447, partial [Boleophthalmus pectinirostris]
WEKSISHFCEVGFRIKAPQFYCCKLNKSEWLPCFDRSAQNPEYNPTEDSPVQPVLTENKFNFDPSSCPGASLTPQSIRDGKRGEKKSATPLNVDLDFPLAAPTDSNIGSVCRNLKVRPHYNIKCLKGLDQVALQAKSINTLEKNFKVCCKNNNKERILPCAQKT